MNLITFKLNFTNELCIKDISFLKKITEKLQAETIDKYIC